MPEYDDYLATISESYRSIDASTQVMTRLLVRLDERVDRLADLQSFAMRLHAYALTLLGLALVGTGWLLYLMWMHVH